MKKLVVVLAALIFGIAPLSVNADGYTFIPYETYGYDEWNTAQTSSAGYIPETTVCSDRGGSAFFSQPQDMVITDDGDIYILNSGDAGIIVLDRNFTLIKQFITFSDADGKETRLSDPSGIFVRDDRLLIADRGLQKVLVCDLSGNIISSLTKPESELFPQEKEFLPTKVLSDSFGNVYVIVDGVYQGAVCFDASGNFIEFFGSNRVVASASVLLQRFWRNFMTEAQRDSTAGIVPTEYSNFDIDAEDFIYSCTAVGSENVNQLRKLNPLGNNIYTERSYGDLESSYVKGKLKQTSFVDVAIDAEGFLFALDATYGRIFVYDSDGNETFIFGAMGEKLGNFTSPTAIETYDDFVYVLDSTKNSVTKFRRTDYGNAVYRATLAYMDGDYEGSRDIWEEVLKYDHNNKLAYNAIGRACYYSGDYENARRYFALGADKQQESSVFNIWRKTFMRRLLIYAVPGLVLCIVLLVFLKKYRKRRKMKCRKN